MSACKWESVHEGATFSLEWCRSCGVLRDVPHDNPKEVAYEFPINQSAVCKKVLKANE